MYGRISIAQLVYVGGVQHDAVVHPARRQGADGVVVVVQGRGRSA